MREVLRLARQTFRDVDDFAVDPRALPLGSKQEYERVGHRFAPYLDTTPIEWTEGVSLTAGERRLVPAAAVFVPYRFPSPKDRILRPTSQGMAAGSTLAEAVLSGLHELVERDAFCVFWENQLEVPTMDLGSLPDGPARQLAAALGEQGVELTCKWTTTDLSVPSVVVMSLQRDRDPPLAAFSARSDLDAESAILGALFELAQTRLEIGEIIERGGVPSDAERLHRMEQFFTYYCRANRLDRLSFVSRGPTMVVPPLRPRDQNPRMAIREVTQRIARAGYEAIVVDVTPVDVAACGISVVRTLVPGLCPITFLRDFRRLGGRRVFDAPVRMGMRAAPLDEGDLNPYPMPGG